ncbi:MAG TPA: TlpA disulfide reductase family protein [Bacteroidales bacterium]|nr:TlpA disulfide reductase family protein [Bacteroidales bacterium]
MRKLIVFLTILPLAVSCGHRHFAKEDGFQVEGSLENADNVQLLLEELTTRELIPLDTVQTDPHGVFKLTHPIEDAGFFILRLNQENFITLLVEPGERIRLTGDAKNLPETYSVEGSKGSSLLHELSKAKRRGYKQLDSLATVFREMKGYDNFQELRQDIDLAFTSIFEQQQRFVKDFIDQHPRSLASILALYQFFANQMLLKETEHFEYFEKLAQSLSGVYPDNKHVVDLKRRVNEWKLDEEHRQNVEERLAAGNIAPEIALPNPSGEIISLSSLRGNIVLIDFWAAWCNPCRQANPKLRELYDRYRNKGFEIYGISLDRNREQWLRGIEEDRINWIQVSDLRFWNSPVVSLYNVEAIPYNVLIDRDGKIIASGLSVAQLEEILSQRLK